MKTFIKLIIATVLVLPFFISTSPVSALEDGQTDSSTTTQSESSLVDKKKQSIEDRIAEHKAAVATKLSNAQKSRLKAKCKASQGKISSVGQRIKGIETSRTQVYKNIMDRLTKLATKLKDKGVNTAELDANLTELQTKIEIFNTDLADFKQIVSDLVEIDCETDPEGFSAALEGARSARQLVNTDGQNIRAYINDSIKPLLKSIRAELETTTTEGEE